MGLWIQIARVAAGANILLLLGLSAIWARNYRSIRSKHALGLLVFGVSMLAENSLALYYYMLHPQLHAWFDAIPAIAAFAMMALRILETFAFVFLFWITWD
ncbi:MAG: hypothetical protein SVG88_13970 [Halobacteriales archaeon]|nr:hypothetical protein [Halobacteriales archaeon]